MRFQINNTLLLVGLGIVATANAFDIRCSVFGSTGKKDCEHLKDRDYDNCVWCSRGSHGFCVTEYQAESLVNTIPRIHCHQRWSDDDDAFDDDYDPRDDDDAAYYDDDDEYYDDDAAYYDDDYEPEDDDIDTDDDNYVPDDYWKCLEQGTNATICSHSGCVWCDTKGGFGICLDKDAAADSSSSDWFDCKTAFDAVESDPYDTSCLVASLEGDEATCEATTDQNGQACEWCTLGSANLCLTLDQADMAGQIGVSCNTIDHKTTVSLDDPYDPSCIAASMEQDEGVCEGTVDAQGDACEWCSLSSVNLCLTADQADIAQQIGADCSTKVETYVEDPYDTSCLTASLEGDESICESTVDQDGQPCEWCALSSVNLCLTTDQSDIAQQLGATCNNSAELSTIEESMEDPYDTSCLVATLEGDEGTCESTTDADGQPCEWCSLSTVALCLTTDQAEIAEQIGGACTSSALRLELEQELKSNDVALPSDFWTCLATVGENDCTAASCSWCNTQGRTSVCLDSELAEALDDCPFFDCSGDIRKVEESSPMDPACLAAGMNGDDAQDVCGDTMDSAGQPCVWCDAAGVFGLCMSEDQAEAASKWLDCDTVAAMA